MDCRLLVHIPIMYIGVKKFLEKVLNGKSAVFIVSLIIVKMQWHGVDS